MDGGRAQPPQGPGDQAVIGTEKELIGEFGGAAAASLPQIRVAGPQVVVEQPAYAGSEAPTVAGNPKPSGLGLLIGVASGAYRPSTAWAMAFIPLVADSPAGRVSVSSGS